jgi:hypothetical protein
VSVVDQTIEDSIGDGGMPNVFMPVFDGKLAGQESGPGNGYGLDRRKSPSLSLFYILFLWQKIDAAKPTLSPSVTRESAKDPFQEEKKMNLYIFFGTPFFNGFMKWPPYTHIVLTR